jgi:hypothetical protein
MTRTVIVSHAIFLAVVVVASIAIAEDKPDNEGKQKTEPLYAYYGEAAAKYEFARDAAREQPLKLVEKPVMKWATDDDWSGGVYVWMRDERPAVIGCLLTGPTEPKGRRIAFQEFHLLSEEPIAPADMAGRYRWAPAEGLTRLRLEGAPEPADTPALRLTQMRQLLREFTAHMEANGVWELRLLPQPLIRYQPKEGPVVDGALFTFVWSKGTDPELILLMECRKTTNGMAWEYAPVRFSNRELWLKHHDQEVWRGLVHREAGTDSDQIYTTRYLDTIDDPRIEAR